MKHPGILVRVLLPIAGFGAIIGLWFSIQYLVTSTLSHLVHSQYELFFAVLTMMMICIAFIAGMLVWASAQPEAVMPRRHHGERLRALFHH